MTHTLAQICRHTHIEMRANACNYDPDTASQLACRASHQSACARSHTRIKHLQYVQHVQQLHARMHVNKIIIRSPTGICMDEAHLLTSVKDIKSSGQSVKLTDLRDLTKTRLNLKSPAATSQQRKDITDTFICNRGCNVATLLLCSPSP